MIIHNAQLLYYNRQPVRVIKVGQIYWWVLCDVAKILKFRYTQNVARILDDSEKQMALVHCMNNTKRVIVINKFGLQKAIRHSAIPEAVDFQQWITYGAFPVISKLDETPAQIDKNLKSIVPVDTKSKSSVEVALQKAAIFVRIAEHRALPQSEQINLLEMALKELTGAGFSNDNSSVKKVNEKIAEVPAQISSAPVQLSNSSDIMDLPEVVGVLKKMHRLTEFNNVKYYLHSVKSIAAACGITIEKFNDWANKANLKNGLWGVWFKVNTLQGEAREYAYAWCVTELYRIYSYNVENGLPAPF